MSDGAQSLNLDEFAKLMKGLCAPIPCGGGVCNRRNCWVVPPSLSSRSARPPSPHLPNLHVPAAVSQRNEFTVLRDRDRLDAGHVRGKGARLGCAGRNDSGDAFIVGDCKAIARGATAYTMPTPRLGSESVFPCGIAARVNRRSQ